jgi:tryptophan-rich sensory protein
VLLGVATAATIKSGSGFHTTLLQNSALSLPLASSSPPLSLLLAPAALLGVATAATIKMADKANPKVIWPLMAPYLMWVTFATALTGEIWRLNPEVRVSAFSKG